MRYGVTVMLTDKSIGIVELAQAVEERGLDSIWLPEHTHIPTSRLTPPPTGDDGAGRGVHAQRRPVHQPRCRRGRDHDGCVSAPASRCPPSANRSSRRRRWPPWTSCPAAASCSAPDSAGTSTRWPTTASITPPAASTPASRCWRCGRSGRTKKPSFDGTFVQLLTELVVAEAGAAAAADPDRRRRRTQALRRTSWSTRRAGSRSAARAWARRCPCCAQAAEDAGRDPNELEIVPFGSLPDRGKLDYFASIGVTECVFRLPVRARARSCCRSWTSRRSSSRSIERADAVPSARLGCAMRGWWVRRSAPQRRAQPWARSARRSRSTAR